MGSKEYVIFKEKSLSQILQFEYASNKFTDTNVSYKNGKLRFSMLLQPTPFSPFIQLK